MINYCEVTISIYTVCTVMRYCYDTIFSNVNMQENNSCDCMRDLTHITTDKTFRSMTE